MFMEHLKSKDYEIGKNVLMMCLLMTGVMKQVNQALAQEEAEHLRQILSRELASIHEDIQ